MSDPHSQRIVLVDASDHSGEVVARRLTAQGYLVEVFSDPALGAHAALAAPPVALIADLWMPGVSGVQLCRLMRAEPATAEMPVILRGQSDDPRSRFWAERAGASAYVAKGRMGELVRILAQAAARAQANDGFFLQLSGGSIDIRDRIARHLDMALFDSVIAAEVRSLASAGSFEKLFDLLSQFLSQVVSYHWMAVLTHEPNQFALHHHPAARSSAEADARRVLGVPSYLPLLRIEDEDARADSCAGAPTVCQISFGAIRIGQLGIAATFQDETESTNLIALVARELGGPLRMSALVEESQRLATTDPLTGLPNRRALLGNLQIEIAHARRHCLPLSLCLLDVDHFKNINDTYGHAAGDQVLAAVGALLPSELRVPDLPARWGGEEFVIVLKQANAEGAVVAAERIRKAIEDRDFNFKGTRFSVTVSIGVAEFVASDSAETFIERADRAMYRAKVGGRNRVEVEEAPAAPGAELAPDAGATLVASAPLG